MAVQNKARHLVPSTFHHGPRLKWRRWRAVSPVSVLGALCDVSLSPRLLVLSATLHRSSSCTGQRPELHRILALLLGGFPLCPHAVYADNMPNFFFFCSVLDLACIVVQFASTKSLLGCCVPASVVQRQRSVYALLVHRVRSYWRFVGFAFSIPALPPQNHYTGPSGSDDDDLCKCNTVVYNLMSACDACQGSSWILCVDQLYFRLHPIQTTDL